MYREGRFRILQQSNPEAAARLLEQAKADVEESEEALKLLDEQAEQLEETWQSAAQDIRYKWDSTLDQVREVIVRAKRTDIEVTFCGLVWFPFWEVVDGDEAVLLPAYIPQ